MWYIEEKLMEEGAKKGRKEGEQSGMRKALHCLIATRFGKVPSWVEERIGAAETDQLQHWVAQAGMANSLEEAFS